MIGEWSRLYLWKCRKIYSVLFSSDVWWFGYLTFDICLLQFITFCRSSGKVGRPISPITIFHFSFFNMFFMFAAKIAWNMYFQIWALHIIIIPLPHSKKKHAKGKWNICYHYQFYYIVNVFYAYISMNALELGVWKNLNPQPLYSAETL